MKKFFLVVGLVLGIIVVAVAGTVGVLAWAALSVPEFYEELDRELADLPEAERVAAADAFEEKTTTLAESIKQPGSWSEEFTQTQINSYLQDRLAESPPKWLPQAISDPRLNLKDGIVQIGFQFSTNQFDGIVSVDVTPEIRSPRELAITFKEVRAGVLSVPLDQVLDRLEQRLKPTKDWSIRWEKDEDDSGRTAVLTFKADLARQPNLKEITITEDQLTLTGETTLRSPDEEEPNEAN